MKRIVIVSIFICAMMSAWSQQIDTVKSKKLIDPALYHEIRAGITNSYLKFSKEKFGRVAFMGGSTTGNPGWREKICKYLQERFPDTKCDFIAAGISSTGSKPGAFRLEDDVLSKGKIDLFFEEAAVNDRGNDPDKTTQIRGMEGIIRHARIANPYMDIVMMYFVDPDKIADYNKGVIPDEIVNHNMIAETYQVASINLAKEVTDRINAHEFTWKDDFKNLHPSPFGQEIYFRSIRTFLENGWSKIEPKTKLRRYILPKQIDKYSYVNGVYVDLKNAKIINNWTLVDSWKPTDEASTRKQYVNCPALIADQPRAELSFAFKGRTVGICVAAGPDAGMIEYSVDGGPLKTLDLFTQWSSGLHIPWYHILADELPVGNHILKIKMAQDKNAKSKGTVCRIIHLLVNKY